MAVLSVHHAGGPLYDHPDRFGDACRHRPGNHDGHHAPVREPGIALGGDGVHLVLPWHANLHAIDFLVALSFGVPFLGSLWGWEITFDTATYFTPFWMAFIGLGLNEGAYLAEIMRAGLLSVPKGQWEAATALGMPRATIFRRIILPQAMRVIVPPIGNETISMLKTTSLVSAIPFTLELTFIARQRGQATFAPVPLLIAAAIWYLVITSLLMWIQSFIEKHFGKGFERRDSAAAATTATTTEDDHGSDKHATTLKFLDVTP